MIELFNKLQTIFGRPITLVSLTDTQMTVRFDWWNGRLFAIHKGGLVYEWGEATPATIWIENLLAGLKRDDEGRMVRP